DEDPEEDPVDYSVDGGDDGDDEDEPSEEDEDDDVDIEADEDEEEEEHPAPADSVVVALPAAHLRLLLDRLEGAPVSTDTELGRHMTAFETRVMQDTDEIYTRTGDHTTGTGDSTTGTGYRITGTAGTRWGPAQPELPKEAGSNS
ncbi:hypothetical protein Tco_0061330, partial [Tanacetum coccineum]